MARQTERVVHTRLGKRSVALDKVLYFPRGLIGFEGLHEFTLLQIREDSPFLMLQCMEDATLGILVADPFSFLKDYDVKIGEAERRLLRIQNVRQLAVLVTVSIPPGEPEKTSLNLSGPICVNHEHRVGLQIPQIDAERPSRFYLHQDQAKY